MAARKYFEQLAFLRQDLSAIVNRRWWRWITMWMLFGSAPAIVSYRLQRSVHLAFGDLSVVVRMMLWPVFFVLRVLGPMADINCRADLGPGLRLLHASLGAVVSGKTVCGRNLVLTGGNCIGSRGATSEGDIRIGDNVTLGVNATVLGPISIGDNCVIGAGAVVIHDAQPNSVLAGVPAIAVRSADGER